MDELAKPNKSKLSHKEKFILALIVEVFFAGIAGLALWFFGTPVWLAVMLYAVANFLFSYGGKDEAKALLK